MQKQVEREIEVAAPIQQVWEAISRSEELGAWFGAEVELDPRPYAPVSFLWPDGALKRGLVETVDPPWMLALRWRTIRSGSNGVVPGDVSRVEFRLEPTPTGTRIVVVESAGIVASDPVEARA